MNESIYACAGSLCCTLVVCAILRIVAPSGSTSKLLTWVFGVFVTLCVLTSVLGVIKNLDFEYKNDELSIKEEEFSIYYEEAITSETAEYVNQYINSLLESKGIYRSIIRTVLDTDEKGIYLKEMNIYLDKKYMSQKDMVKELVLSSTGIYAEVLESSYG